MKNLTLKELNILTQHYLQEGLNEDTPILITTADNSIGGRAFVAATTLSEGFDWERGQLRISTEEKIIKYKNNRDNVIHPVVRHYDINGRNSTVISCPKCENKLRKDDCYCSRCGQKVQ